MAGYYLGKTVVELVTQVPGALETSALVCLSHVPLAGKGVLQRKLHRRPGLPWLAQLSAVISAEKQKVQSSGPTC